MYLRWALVFEDPRTRAVWFGKALPREWLEATATAVKLHRVPTRYGRISMTMKAVAGGAGAAGGTESVEAHGSDLSAPRGAPYAVHASLMLPEGFAPPGGLKLRVRVPLHAGKIVGVAVGGEAWKEFNVAEETVNFAASTLTPGMVARLKAVVVTFKH